MSRYVEATTGNPFSAGATVCSRGTVFTTYKGGDHTTQIAIPDGDEQILIRKTDAYGTFGYWRNILPNSPSGLTPTSDLNNLDNGYYHAENYNSWAMASQLPGIVWHCAIEQKGIWNAKGTYGYIEQSYRMFLTSGGIVEYRRCLMWDTWSDWAKVNN